jgi:hypothetical protein
MTFAYSLVVLSALSLVVLLLLAKGYWFARSTTIPSPADLHVIDVEAFRNLIDDDEEAYLRHHLSARDFRRIYRERMLAAIEYVHAAYHNAGILVTIADAARESADPLVAETAGRLFENATRLRWYTAKVVPRLYFNLLFPGANHASRQLFDRYDTLTREAIMLGRSVGRSA